MLFFYEKWTQKFTKVQFFRVHFPCFQKKGQFLGRQFSAFLKNGSIFGVSIFSILLYVQSNHNNCGNHSQSVPSTYKSVVILLSKTLLYIQLITKIRDVFVWKPLQLNFDLFSMMPTNHAKMINSGLRCPDFNAWVHFDNVK